MHEGAQDFARLTHSGHRWLIRRFSEIESEAVGGPGLVSVRPVRYLVRGLARTKLVGILGALATFWLRFLEALMPATFRIDGASAVWFLGRRSESELSAKEMVGYYRGAGRR